MSTLILTLLLAAAAVWALAPVLVVALPRSQVRLALVAGAGVGGSLCCALAGMLAIAHPTPATISLGSWQGLGDAGVRVDALSGLFLVLTGGVSALLFVARFATLPHLRGKLHITALVGMLISLEAIFVADNAFFFMAGWEGLALTFWMLVATGYRQCFGATDAARWTMSMTKLGGAAVLVAFLLLGTGTRSFDFADFRAHGSSLHPALANAVLVLAFVGFGVKMAMLPLQSWLPRAYPVAPTGAPAFLAAVALNAGFYGFVRVVSFLGAGMIWWGLLVLLTGAVTAFAGVLYATVQTDLKALISYSSIENVGIILCGVGASMVGRAAHLPLLAGLGLLAALFQVAVHSVAKAALFVCADIVERHAGTTDMERLGGLVRRLPATTAVFLVAAATIIGLPPFGGFPSEWLTLETLMQGFRVPVLAAEVSLALAGALLALTAAVAGIAFVKAAFVTFLGVPRGPRPAIRVGRAAVVGAGALPLPGGPLGVAAPWVVLALGRAAAGGAVPDVGAEVSTGSLLIEPAFAHFSSIAPTEVAIVVPGFVVALLAVGSLVRNRRVGVVRTPTWNSAAVPFQPRTQYTATGWSNPTRVVFDSLLRTRRRRTPVGPTLAPREVRYSSRVPALVDDLLVLPLARGVNWVARRTQGLQSGSLAQYLLYVLVVLVAVLVLVPVGR